MFFSSKRRGAARDISGQSRKARGQKAVLAAIEALETRTLMSTVTYTVQGNSDTVASIVTPSGANQYTANTLRAAVTSANNQSFPVVIQFNAAKFNGGSANTITLTSGLTLGPVSPAGTHSYKFVGPTAKPVTVSGNNLYTDFTANVGISAEFDTLTIAHAKSTGDGGGINANGPLTLVGDTFASDTAEYGGGAYSNTGQVTVTNSTFIGDSASEAGGGLYTYLTNSAAAPSISGSTFSSNTSEYGGAIGEDGTIAATTFAITNSTFTGNSASEYAGAVYFENDAVSDTALTTTISKSTFSGDTAPYYGGAVYSGENTSLTVTADTFTSDKVNGTVDAYGGAIYSEDASLNVSGSIFTTDSSYDAGGAIYYDGENTLSVTSSSFAGDKSLDSDGGAIYTSEAVTTITASSFTGDTAYSDGGALYNDADDLGSLTVTNDTFSNDSATDGYGGAFYDEYTPSLAISGSTFSNDSAEDYGGAVCDSYAYGAVTVTNSSFTNDSALYAGGGLDLYTDDYGGTASITNCTFTNDTETYSDSSDSFYGGGGIESYYTSSVTVTSSTFTNDTAYYAGGIDSYEDGSLTVANSVFTTDTASFSGGGIYAYDETTVTVSGSTLTGDSATGSDYGGGFYGDDITTVNLATDTFAANTADDGGAAYVEATTLNVSQSTFTGNSATYGGAIYVDADTSNIFDSTFKGNMANGGDGGAAYDDSAASNYANDTFYGNSAGDYGGALYLDSSDAVVTDSTIDANSASFADGGGIYNDDTALLDGDIVAGNFVTGTPNTFTDLAGTFDPTSTDNIIGDGLGQTGFTAGNVGGNFVGTDFQPIDPMLGALANNGGPTQTQIPASTSLAIGNNQDWPVLDSGGNDVTQTDQTGLNTRPQDQGYDIGAYQTGATPVVVTPSVAMSAPATKHVPASGTTTILVPVTLSSTATSAIVLTYSTIGVTASSGNGDYTGVTNATHTIPAGSAAGTYYITISGIKHETAHGAYPKTFQVKLTAATNATVVGGTETVTVTLAYP